MFHDLHVNDMIQLGRYPQAANGAVLPIDWRVLAVDPEKHRALVLSEYVLDMQPFHDQSVPAYWPQSALRQWLHSDFMQVAFPPQEQALILRGEAYDTEDDLFLWSALGMEDATSSIADPIFLLSRADIPQYYPGESPLFCTGASAKATPWVQARYKNEGDWNGERVCSWLRSSMSQAPMAYIISPVDSVGCSVVDPANLNGVRPAMWIRMA